jgi:Spy/CpxP family protein refolding chaperone
MHAPCLPLSHAHTTSLRIRPPQIAAGLADTIMQQFFSERRHYREYKTELSPDFSDVRAKVEQLEKQSQSRQQKAMNYA